MRSEPHLLLRQLTTTSEIEPVVSAPCRAHAGRIDSKAIVTGYPHQSDLDPEPSGLVPCANALRGSKGIGFVLFDRTEIVRSKVVSTVLEALGE